MKDVVGEPWWHKEGYIGGKEIGGGLWICLAEMITTWRIMICDPDSVHEFWCYPKAGIDGFNVVVNAYRDFDGTGDPADGWVKHFPSERRRAPVS